MTLTLSACGSSGGGAGSSRRRVHVDPPPADSIQLSPTETASALADPQRVEDGVWSLLSNLGIGVYTSDGEQILAGSETGPDDFWLYDFDVPLLASMANRPDQPFDNYYLLVSQFGIDISEEEMLADYRRVYAQFEDEYLVRLFDAMGMTFDENMRLTPLQEWLLFLDTFVPGNPQPSQTTQRVPSLVLMSLIAAPAQAGPCDRITGGGANYLWSIAGKVVSWARDAAKGFTGGVSSFVDPVDIVHALMMMDAVKTSLKPSPGLVHEGHGGSKGDTVTYTARVSFNGAGIPDWVVSCGAVLGFDVPADGALSEVMTEWHPDNILNKHGTMRYPEQGGFAAVAQPITGDSGQVEVKWVARPEPADGEGISKIEDGWMEVTFRIQRADVFNIWAGAQEWFLPRTERVLIGVGFHEILWILNMSLEIPEESGGSINILWQGTFQVDEENQIFGAGDGDILGFLPNGPCIYISSSGAEDRKTTVDINGTFSFAITGKQVGQEFDLEIEGFNTKQNFAFSDPNCDLGTDYMLLGPFIESFVQTPNAWVGLTFIQIPARNGASRSFPFADISVLEVSVEASDAP